MATQKKASTTTKKTATSARDWRGRGGTELELPSGNTALVRNPGIQHFMKIGIIPNSLRGIVSQAIQSGKTDLHTEDLLKDESDLDQLLEMFDKVLIHTVIEPKVKPVPTDEEGQIVPLEDRDQDFIYPDEVDFNDKAFIFQFAVGGTRDLESFRQQQVASMAAVRPGADVELPTE